MTIRSIFAGLIAAVMLSVSSMAAACDLSCSFAQRRTDCHAHGVKNHSSAASSMRMDDMAMDGMVMPDVAAGEDQMAALAKPEPRAGHPSIGEMGPCERQSCDSSSAVSARAARTAGPQFHLVLAPSRGLLAARASPVFHDARDDVATRVPRDEGPLSLSLRI